MIMRQIDHASLAGVLALNNTRAAELSLLDPAGLEMLVARAFLAGQVGNVDAFTICFDQDASYDNANFMWLKQRIARFVYIDRIAVAPSARGQGLARRMYGEVFDRARDAGHGTVCCEVNAEPPNLASDAFHAALGFGVIGQQALRDIGKTVRYFAVHIDAAAAGRRP
jgi:uncharacterized protein